MINGSIDVPIEFDEDVRHEPIDAAHLVGVVNVTNAWNGNAAADVPAIGSC